MGYTHYFGLTKLPTEKQVEKVIEEVKMLYSKLPEKNQTAGGYCSEYPIAIRGGMGHGEPTFDTRGLWFNGDETVGMDHETFWLSFTSTDREFCKTARKPYDMLACLSLISAKRHIPGFKFSSDGDLEDWQPAFDFYRQHVKTKAKLENWVRQ